MRLAGWKRLLERALAGLDSLEQNGTPIRWWSFGGGTALMVQLHHRDSKDIDLFVPDPQYLSYLSPRLADVAVWGGPDYDEATNYVKLRYAEGEIDFISAFSISDLDNGRFVFSDRQVPIESPTEIILKKLHYRAGLLKPRDIFDTAVVLSSDHAETLRQHLPLLTDVRGQLIDRISQMPEDYFKAAMDELDIFSEYRQLIPNAMDMVAELISDIPPPSPAPNRSRHL